MSNYLSPGQSLYPNAPLVSASGAYQVILQDDGNLVLYQNDGYKPLWATNTVGKGGIIATFQPDGNFVMYTADDEAVWATQTMGKHGMIMIMQDDGNFVMYPTAVWATGT